MERLDTEPVVDATPASVAPRAPRPVAGPAARRPGRRVQDRVITSVLDVLPTGVVVVDGTNTVITCNPSARAMLAVSGDVLRVTALRELAALARREDASQEAIVVLPQRLEPPLRRPRRDREAPEAKVTAIPLDLAVGDHHDLADGAGSPAGVVTLLLEDVTEQRRVDAVRRDFVANVSHELKTPVGAMHLLAEAIVESPDDPETVRRFATRMTAESERLANLVQELIDLSRLQGAEPMEHAAAIEMDAVVHEAVDRVRLAADAKGIEVVTRGQTAQIVDGDERQLVTALTNLLANAVSYSPAGTRVTLGIVRRSGWVECSVADEGIGIPESEQERVFERFYRVDPARSRATGGTGLGLAIVKHVATNHGGEVTLWSRPDAGSTFTLRLPASVSAHGRVTEGEPRS